MALKLLNYPEIFFKNFMDSFKSLANDKVANVRLTMAKILQAHWNKKGIKSKHLIRSNKIILYLWLFFFRKNEKRTRNYRNCKYS